jgi:hypothetical protein
MNARKGATVVGMFHVLAQDVGRVAVRITTEVPDGYEIEQIGMGRGDPLWNDGQGYVVLKLSVSKASNAVVQSAGEPA